MDLLLRVDEGAQYLFGTLHVEGLDLNGEAAIKKLWSMKEGKPFNPTYPGYFLSRVRDEGVFDNLGETRSEVKTDERAHTVDVTLYFKYGAPPGRKRDGDPTRTPGSEPTPNP